MPSYSYSHLADQPLVQPLRAVAAQGHENTAECIALIAEVDARQLYLPAGYPSMLAFCVGELRFSRDAARKRIHAAHAAVKVPAVFTAVAGGRLDLSAVVALAPHLTAANAAELLAAATYKTRFEIEQLVAAWAPKLDVPTQVEVIAAPASLAPPETPSLLPQATACAPGRTISPAGRTKLAPLAPGKVALHMTITQEIYDDLRYAQALDSHAVPSGDPVQVLARALKDYVRRLEQRRFAPSARSHRGKGRPSKNPRHIPMSVRREVWLRDGGQCAFVSASGKRCPARTRLEFDHVDPVARRSHPSQSGPPTADRIRLCCRAHNQYAAEQVYGAGFMREKREQAQRDAAETNTRGATEASGRQVSEPADCGGPEASSDDVPASEAPNPRVVTAAEFREMGLWKRRTHRPDEDPDRDVAPWLRALGCRKEEIQRGMELCEAIPDATMEEKLKYALKGIRRGLHRKIPFVSIAPSSNTTGGAMAR